MSARRPLNVLEIIDRMKASCGFKSDAELANHLEVSNKTVSSWRSRNSLPIEAILQLTYETGLMVEYFLWGDSDKRIDTDLNFSDVRLNDFEIAGSSALVEVLKEIDEEKLAFMDEAEIEKLGSNLGVTMMALLGLVRQERRALLDTGKMDEAEFEEYARKAFRNDLPHFLRSIKKRNARRGKGPQ